MEDSQGIQIIFKDQTYLCLLKKECKLEEFKNDLCEAFNINKKEFRIKLFSPEIPEKEIEDNSEFEEWKNSNLQKISLEIFPFPDLLNNIELTESLKIERKSLNSDQRLNSSSFSIMSISGSKLLEEKKENISDKIVDIENEKIEKNYTIVTKEEAEEILDQIKAKTEIQKQICGKCPFPPNGARYFCMFCEDMILCENCESSHIHPLIKFNSNQVRDKDEMLKFLSTANQSSENPTFASKIRNSFVIQKLSSIFLKKRVHTVEISIPKKEIIIPPNSEGTVMLTVTNVSISTSLPKGLTIYPLNSRDLLISSACLDFDIPPKGKVEIPIMVKTPDKIEEISLKFTVFEKEEEISCNCKDSLIVRVGFDESLTYNQFFVEHAKILSLPVSKQKKIYDLIINEVCSKNPSEILKILKKHKWRVEKAMDDLLA